MAHRREHIVGDTLKVYLAVNAQSCGLFPDLLQPGALSKKAHPGGYSPLIQKNQGLQNRLMVLLGVKSAHMDQFHRIVQAVVGLSLAPAQIDAVEHHRNLPLRQSIEPYNGVPDPGTQGNRQRLPPTEEEAADFLVQRNRLLLCLVVDGMDHRHAGEGQRRVFQGVQVGMEHLGPLPANQRSEPAHAAQVHAGLFVQKAYFHTGIHKLPGNLGGNGGKADGHHRMAHGGKGLAQPRAHGFRTAHLKAGNDLHDFHGLHLSKP